MHEKLFEVVPKEVVQQLVYRVKSLLDKKSLNDLYKFPIKDPLSQYANYDQFAKWPSELLNEKLNDFEMTLKLRAKMRAELESKMTNKKETIQIAKWIVKEWGGIKTGKDENLEASIDSAQKSHERKDGKFSFERIASWSKFMAFKYPKDYAIYDARVVYSLNWMLLKTQSGDNEKLKFFPILEGRNSVMGLLDYRLRLLLIHHSKEYIEKKLEERQGKKTHFLSGLEESVFVDSTVAFSIYCELLKEIAKGVFDQENGDFRKDPDYGLTKIEMLLFSIADQDIARDVLMDVEVITVRDK